MLRAKETAAIIAPALRAPLLLDENVREWHPGEAEGMHQDEIQEKYGKDNPSLWSNPFQPLAPGGENWGQFVLRVGTALDRITRQCEGKTVVIVCHGGIIEISFLYFSGIAMLDLPPVHYYNSPSSITYWRKVPFDGWPAGWEWFVVIFTLLFVPGSIITYKWQVEYHNNKSILAIGIFALLALTALFLAIAQARAILPTRSSNGTLFLTIFLLTLAVWQLAFSYKSLRSRGWRIFRVCFAVFAVVLAISVVVGYIYNV